MRIRARIILVLLMILCLSACDNYTTVGSTFRFVYDKDVRYEYVFSNDVLECAYQMAFMEWTPIKPVPYKDDCYFDSDVKVIGVPYSSVKEINTYLFQDVSYHTFITALHNPYSVLYTENICKPPYHGLNCGTYYGAVCSSSIMWALGINIPYYANQITELSCMTELDCQIIDSLKVCDIVWQPGHVQMIYDLKYEDNTLCQVTLFESSGNTAHLSTFSAEDFNKLWHENGYVGYRYKYLIYSDDEFNPKPLGPIMCNDDLSTSKGDKAIYRTDDVIIINILNLKYDVIVLYKDGVEYQREQIRNDIHHYKDLSPGFYSVLLYNNKEVSSLISFEVEYVDVSFAIEKKNILLNFRSSIVPEYAALCTITGDSVYFPISEEDRMNGFIVIPQMKEKEYYCKVIFRGEYGTLINQPLRVL